MLIALAIVLLVLAVLGGIAVHPLLFALAIIALLLLFSGRLGFGHRGRGRPAPPRSHRALTQSSGGPART